MSAFKGDKIGLIGPNGSGKSTIFRMIIREEAPDGGQVAIDRDVTVGYFSQDVGEMAGRSVLEETLAGASAVSEAAHEVRELEHAMADPERLDELDARAPWPRPNPASISSPSRVADAAWSMSPRAARA